jgi:hypothetical protein
MDGPKVAGEVIDRADHRQAPRRVLPVANGWHPLPSIPVAARPRMPTAEYTELLHRIEDIDSRIEQFVDALLRLLGQASGLSSRPSAHGT